ncbi:hypothetical protein [Alienimonas chondri]|uniref:Type II secretion system protein n=1 Tax=Alienimonas chondri TaxID=2681879 RepID=A0ABX1VDU1_9PLAN|nr:hypothetical protein [Alienimonas chondri]NNJ25463.1 hypothetical protein [Alienimonas chondri]
MELIVAVALLLSVTAMLLPAARRVDGVRVEADRRRRAVAELSNLLEDLSRLPPDRLSGETEGGPLPPDRAALREAFAASLPGASVTVEAVPIEAPGERDAVRLDGSLTWTTDAGGAARPVRLSAWSFAPFSTAPNGGGTDE